MRGSNDSMMLRGADAPALESRSVATRPPGPAAP